MLRPKLKTEEIIRDGERYLICAVENTLHKQFISYDIKLPDGMTPFICYTATTGMIEVIGRMKDKDTAEGYYKGRMKQFCVNNIGGYTAGERVIISEHLKLDGTIETKQADAA